MKIIDNIMATDSNDVRKSIRDAVVFAAGLFALKFLGHLDPNSIQANTIETLKAGVWDGANAVYSSWLALLMPMLMRTLRSGETPAQ